LTDLLSDEPRCRRIAANGYARARRHFSLDAMLANVELEVDSVLAKNP
jgi:hypothetical protein